MSGIEKVFGIPKDDTERRLILCRKKKKLDNVARTLTAIGEWNFPALIGLCEVENDTVMRDLTFEIPDGEGRVG